MNLRVLLPVSLLLLATGCASLGIGGSPEEQVARRAGEHMQAFLDNDFKKAYTYMTPGYRDTHTYQMFASDHIGLVDLVSFEVRRVTCEEDRCEVVVGREQKALQGILGTARKPAVLPMVMHQTWLRTGSKWYRYKK